MLGGHLVPTERKRGAVQPRCFLEPVLLERHVAGGFSGLDGTRSITGDRHLGPMPRQFREV